MPYAMTDATAAAAPRKYTWRWLDAELLRHHPELWLMKLHLVVLGSLSACLGFAVVGLCIPLSLTDHPMLSGELDVILLLSILIVFGWSWRYLSYVTPVHVCLQWHPWKLFLGHLVCTLLILSPPRLLPAVLFWRFDAIVAANPDWKREMRAHLDACDRINRRWSSRELDSDPLPLKYGLVACFAWEESINYIHRPDRSTLPSYDRVDALRAADELLAIHRGHGIPIDDTSLKAIQVPSYYKREQVNVSVSSRKLGDDLPLPPLEDRHSWLSDYYARVSKPSSSITAVTKLINSWCYAAGARTGLCAFPSPSSPDHAVLKRSARVFESIAHARMQVICGTLVACLTALLLTVARLERVRRFIRVAAVVFAVDTTLPLLIRDYGYTDVLRNTLTVAMILILGVTLFFNHTKRYRSGLQELVDHLAAVGCLVLPLLPVLWTPKWYTSVQGASLVVFDLILNDSINWSSKYFYAEKATLPAYHWLVAAGVVFGSFLAAWILMNSWRRIQVQPEP